MEDFLDTFENTLAEEGILTSDSDFISDEQKHVFNEIQKYTEKSLKQCGVDIDLNDIKTYFEDKDIYTFIFDLISTHVLNVAYEANDETDAGLTDKQINSFVDNISNGLVENEGELEQQLKDVLEH